jgi:hypothetical protein
MKPITHFTRYAHAAGLLVKRTDRTVLIALTVAVLSFATLVAWFFSGGNPIEVTNNEPGGTGLPTTTCDESDRRPYAIMLASDPQARPLSGIGTADLVFEMPVTPNGITRMMAVYRCNLPDEIGSIRSARLDFLDLVERIDAIYVHWGGERDALAHLEAGRLDNINALIYDGSVFYRKQDVPPPHNGFTSAERLQKKADELRYPDTTDIIWWSERDKPPRRSLTNTTNTLSLTYGSSHIRWTYDETSNSWLRERDGIPETDARTGEVVRAGAVLLIKSEETLLRDDYLSVRATGSGRGALYQDGIRQEIRWEGNGIAPLRLTDPTSGTVIGIAPGPVWVQFVTESVSVSL